MLMVANGSGSLHQSAMSSSQSYITNTMCKVQTYKSASVVLEESTTRPGPVPASEAPGPAPTTADYTLTGRWVRRLGYAERFMTHAHDYGCMTTVYSLWLESRMPLDFELIKQASVLMFRKMPNLRLHLDYLDGDLWWREMTREVVDVEELSTHDVEATVQNLVRRRYRVHDGPLWFTRFVTLDPSEECVRDSNHNLKYKYVCIFGFHHNISDGSTNMKFCQVFLKVLNALVEGKHVNLCQEGTFSVPVHDELGKKISSIWFVAGIFLQRFYTVVLTWGLPLWNFTHYYRMPIKREAATHVLQNELDEITTSKLLSRCKMEGVTLNSAFTAAANIALYKMILAKNSSIEEENICSQQAINMRRYWPKSLRENAFGCHISLLDLKFPTRRSDLTAFWEYTRGIHSVLHHHLTVSLRPLKLQPMSENLSIIIRYNAVLAKLGLPTANDNHYTVTNMGNLSSTFPGTGAEVEVSKVLRSVSCHFMPTLCQHTLQTFRGRLCYSLDYYTQKMTREIASQYAEEILSVLTSSIHTPN
ncbi:uncharacterized protein [Procambarus clarkii]|nr:uncharacterized protein LOC123768480 isoform X2 [Procambarus clarkii]XP_045615195.1 uncharacterized protein LOC123768480 isoform X2 [Procambarus clarkii]